MRSEVSTGKTKVWRLNLECLLRAELLALVGELRSTRLMRTVLKLVRQILERLCIAVLFHNVAALQKKHECKHVGGEQYRDKKGWNVDCGTEESHVGNLSDAFIVGVQKIGRAPEIQDPDDWNCKRPTPRERRN